MLFRSRPRPLQLGPEQGKLWARPRPAWARPLPFLDDLAFQSFRQVWDRARAILLLRELAEKQFSFEEGSHDVVANN